VTFAASRGVRDDGLTRTSLRIGRDLSASSIAHVVHALQRVPGVLTVDADAENAQMFVAHDAAVPTASLVTAASCAGAAASVVVAATRATGAAVVTSVAAVPGLRQSQLTIVAMVAMFALVLIDVAFPNSPNKHWFFVMPVVVLWAFILLRATLNRKL
jgi:hypothetical protein